MAAYHTYLVVRLVCFANIVSALKFLRNAGEFHRQTLDNIEDLAYYGNLTVGGQQMQGIFDTGFIELVVLSEACKDRCGNTRKKLLYNSSQSSGYIQGNFSLRLNYGSGQLVGREAYDNVAIGPFSSSSTPFWEAIDAMMPLLITSDFDAIVGLGPIPANVINFVPGSPNNLHGYAVLLESLGLSHSQFSVCLGNQAGSAGYLTWNDDSISKNPAAFSMLKVENTGYWMAKLEDVRVGSTMLACADGCGAVLDSGTSLIAMPNLIKERLTQLIRSVTKDCTNVLDLPELKFKMSGVEYTLPADAYLGQVFGSASHDLEDHFQITNSSLCQVAVMTVDMQSAIGPTWVMGMPFFRKFFTVFAQRTASEPPKLYTAKADPHCYPQKDTNATSLESQGRSFAVRRVNAARVRMSPWLRMAARFGMDSHILRHHRLAS